MLHATGISPFQETKSGSYIYYGDAASFHEWEFRTRLRVKGKKEEYYAEAMSKVVDGLRGDAFVIAQQVGLENLWQSGSPPEDEDGKDNGPTSASPAGVDLLVDAMKKAVFALTSPCPTRLRS